jgi:hypothetical protein
MKELGTTPEGGKIVEFTHQEAAELARLIAVSKDKYDSMRWNFEENLEQVAYGTELDGLFGAIRAFREANYRINSLKNLVAHLEKTLNKDDNANAV